MRYIVPICLGCYFFIFFRQPVATVSTAVYNAPARSAAQHNVHQQHSIYGQHQKFTLLIRGIFDSSGNSLLQIEKPVLYKRALPYPIHNQQAGKYVLVIKYAAGDSSSTWFDALVAGDSKDAGSQHGFFELQIPANENIHRIVLSATHSKRVFAIFNKKEIVVRK